MGNQLVTGTLSLPKALVSRSSEGVQGWCPALQDFIQHSARCPPLPLPKGTASAKFLQPFKIHPFAWWYSVQNHGVTPRTHQRAASVAGFISRSKDFRVEDTEVQLLHSSMGRSIPRRGQYAHNPLQ